MALLSISAAARAAGRHRTTLQGHIKSGKLTVTQDAAGRPQIDTAELMRVYGPLTSCDSSASSTSSPLLPDDSAALVSTLQRQLEAAREREIWLQACIDQLAERNDELMSYFMPPAEPELEPEVEDYRPRRGFWAWLTGN